MLAFRTGAVFGVVLIGLSATLLIASRNVTEVLREHHVATEEESEVCAVVELGGQRRAAARQIAVKLSANPEALATAADELIAVFGDDAGMLSTLRLNHPDAPTRRHAFALHAIDRVRGLLANDPDRCAEVVARLEGEYRGMCAAPESSPSPEAP